MRITREWILSLFALLAVFGVVFGRIWGGIGPITISIENHNELIGNSDYSINVETNAPIIEVNINGEIVDTFFVVTGKMKYKIYDAMKLHDGWNYISFKAKTLKNKEFAMIGGAINVIANGPDIYVPDVNLFDARNRNKLYHKGIKYYDDFLSHFSYSWNSTTMDGIIYDEYCDEIEPPNPTQRASRSDAESHPFSLENLLLRAT